MAPDGRKIYVTCSLSNEVWEIDGSTHRVLRKIRVGDKPAHMVFSPDDSVMYVSLLGDAAVAAVNLKAGSVVNRIGVGREPYDLAITPGGDRLYVTDFGEDAISVIDLKSQKEVERWPAGDGCAGLALSPDARLLYSGGHGYDQNWREIWVYDAASGQKLKTIVCEGEDLMPAVLKYPSTGSNLWALMDKGTSVLLMDKDDRIIKKITVGLSPQDITFSSDGTKAYVLNTDDDTLCIIETENGQVIGEYPAGRVPTGILYREARS